jgi:hypothetical protein
VNLQSGQWHRRLAQETKILRQDSGEDARPERPTADIATPAGVHDSQMMIEAAAL